MNEMTVNDSYSDVCVFEVKNRSLVNTGNISPEIASVKTRLRRKRAVKEMRFNFLRNREV